MQRYKQSQIDNGTHKKKDVDLIKQEDKLKRGCGSLLRSNYNFMENKPKKLNLIK